jgi:ABC-type multidrug transport system fused ATPase/permease subunit
MSKRSEAFPYIKWTVIVLTGLMIAAWIGLICIVYLTEDQAIDYFHEINVYKNKTKEEVRDIWHPFVIALITVGSVRVVVYAIGIIAVFKERYCLSITFAIVMTIQLVFTFMMFLTLLFEIILLIFIWIFVCLLK